jgi:hypothetical protein
MNTPGLLRDIISELTGESGDRPIGRQRVLEWMRTDDIECIGAIYSLITDHFDRIQPALQFNEYHPFVLAYFQRSLLEDPQSEWTETRYGAGHNIIGWFVWSWRDPSQRSAAAAEMRVLGVEKKPFGGACVGTQDQTHRSQRRESYRCHCERGATE